MALPALGSKRPFGVNPWALILLTSLIPLLLFIFILIKWYRQSTDFRRVTSHFLERQNTVMAYDAMEVSTGVSDLLEKAARDIVVLSLIPPSESAYLSFYRTQISDYTQFGSDEEEVPNQIPLPFYNKVFFINAKGQIAVNIQNGKPSSTPATVSECKEAELCDRKLLERIYGAKEGEILYGGVFRYYSTSQEPIDDTNASLHVAYRGKSGIYVLGLEYRHIRDHLTTLVFPYEVKRNLVQSYLNGNYIYLVDSQYNMIAHPKYWNVLGIDKKTGTWVPPMRNDADEGYRPINIAAYQEGVLKDYFQRLISRSFGKRGVDIFQAPNLAGTTRVLSVAPIFLSKGQFKSTGIFGYVIIGCSVEYFEEPKEKLVPYY